MQFIYHLANTTKNVRKSDGKIRSSIEITSRLSSDLRRAREGKMNVTKLLHFLHSSIFFFSLCDNVKCWFNFHLSDIGFMTCTVWWCVELAQGVFLWRCICCYLSASFARILNGIQTEYKRTRFSIEFLNSKCNIRMVLCIRFNHKMWLFSKVFPTFSVCHLQRM